MNRNVRVILGVTCIALSTLACQSLNKVTEVPSIPDLPDIQTEESNTVPSSGDIILRDDFSSERWGTGTDSDSSVEYVSGALQFIVFTENYFVWSTPDGVDYENIHMEVTVNASGTDSTTAFGFLCDMALSGSNGYYFAMTPAGEYAIAKSAVGQDDLFLTNNDQWGKSNSIGVQQDSYRVGADCGNGVLTLYVDGVEIDTVYDSTYTTGNVALLVWSGEEAGSIANVSFDDFVMSDLP